MRAYLFGKCSLISSVGKATICSELISQKQQLKGETNLINLKVSSALLVALIAAVFLVGCSKAEEAPERIMHIHGLGYSADGKKIYIPSHDGIVVYSESKWNYAPGDKHDYMGFSNVDNGFYSSGHPAPGSDLLNPLGIVSSNDEGKTITQLGLEGIEDFHGLSAGYRSHTLYVFNSVISDPMSELGLYSSQDNAKSWNLSGLHGLLGQPTSLAAHPDEPGTVVIGTDTGVYLSKDFGNHFEKMPLEEGITTVAFGSSGELFVGGNVGKLFKYSDNSFTEYQVSKNGVPLEKEITFVAQNPSNPSELVIADKDLNVMVSQDNGKSWSSIVVQGSLQ